LSSVAISADFANRDENAPRQGSGSILGQSPVAIAVRT
jgi:hypothetical protein